MKFSWRGLFKAIGDGIMVGGLTTVMTPGPDGRITGTTIGLGLGVIILKTVANFMEKVDK